MAALEDSIYFMQRIAEFFHTCPSDMKIKQAFCEMFTELLAPLSSVVSAETNMPQWIKFVDLIYAKAFRMLVKPKHYHVLLFLFAR